MLVVALPEGISSPATHMAIGSERMFKQPSKPQPPLYPPKRRIE